MHTIVRRTSRRWASRTLALVALLAIVALAWASPYASAAGAEPGDLRAFALAYGDPPGTGAMRLRIPSIGVDAPIGSSRATLYGAMPMPQGPADVLAYDLSDWWHLGGTIGRGGNAVISGHLDYAARVAYAGTRYDGPAVFTSLAKVQPGDPITVTGDGQTIDYFVAWRRVEAPDTDHWASLMTADVPVESLTLFTCGGDFDSATREYSNRVVVRAERVVGSAGWFPMPEPGKVTFGSAQSNDPRRIVAGQPFEVQVLWTQDTDSGEWVSYIPGAPAFASTAFGHLRPGALVLLYRR